LLLSVNGTNLFKLNKYYTTKNNYKDKNKKKKTKKKDKSKSKIFLEVFYFLSSLDVKGKLVDNHLHHLLI
jgi:hypothetical protein